jgi:hypothetical protein
MNKYYFKKWQWSFIFLLIFGSATSCNNPANYSPNTAKVIADTILTLRVVKNTEPQCTEWKAPKKSEILSLLYSLYKVTGREWNDCYGDWSCGIEGELMFKNKKCYYRLDAGGWIILNDGENQQYFVCKDENCWKLFPSESFCDIKGNRIDTP